MTEVSAVLKRIRDARPAPRSQPGERCEVCQVPIGGEHSHVVDLEQRSLMCACRPCWLVFAPDGAGGTRFRAVPERYLSFAGLVGGSAWERLQIPVGVAFFFLNSTIDQLAAFYPSPAGATESLLDLDAWTDLVTANPQLATLSPDVEALLVRTADQRADAPTEWFIVPIDICYELVGELRRLWRGFDGGAEAQSAVDVFFQRVRDRAVTEVRA